MQRRLCVYSPIMNDRATAAAVTDAHPGLENVASHSKMLPMGIDSLDLLQRIPSRICNMQQERGQSRAAKEEGLQRFPFPSRKDEVVGLSRAFGSRGGGGRGRGEAAGEVERRQRAGSRGAPTAGRRSKSGSGEVEPEGQRRCGWEDDGATACGGTRSTSSRGGAGGWPVGETGARRRVEELGARRRTGGAGEIRPEESRACGAREAAKGRRSPAPRVPIGRREEKGDRGGSGSLDGWFAERQKFLSYAVAGGTTLILQLPLR
jgi:hypothetical protein